jgi:hypothetical protein
MSRKTAANDKLAAIDKELNAARTKVTELLNQRKAVELEQRKAANLVVLANVDALLVFATHTFRDCDDARPYKNPNCPRCALLTAKADGYIPDDVSFNVSIQTETHGDDGDVR